MKKLNEQFVETVRQHARDNPQDTYSQIATSFGISEASVKRYCAGLGRSKGWRRGKYTDFDPQRLWSNVEKKERGCWTWKGCTNQSGYGSIYASGKTVGVHRLAYELSRGPIPDDMDIDHGCKNRSCCNPDHLELVSHAENMRRMRASGQGLSSIDTGCPSRITPPSIDPYRRPAPHATFMHESTIISDNRLQSVTGAEAGEGSVSREVSNSERRPLVSAPRPAMAEPYAPCASYSPFQGFSLPDEAAKPEPMNGTKADLGIDHWSQTLFGAYWFNQTDEQLAAYPIEWQTDRMRESEESLHWYRVLPDPEDTDAKPKYYSARNGPEACAKCDRELGMEWAFGWEYLRPDPHCRPFAYYSIRLTNHAGVEVVARSERDAIAMVDEVWGHGVVLTCKKSGLELSDGHLRNWHENWRLWLEKQKEKIEKAQEEDRLKSSNKWRIGNNK